MALLYDVNSSRTPGMLAYIRNRYRHTWVKAVTSACFYNTGIVKKLYKRFACMKITFYQAYYSLFSYIFFPVELIDFATDSYATAMVMKKSGLPDVDAELMGVEDVNQAMEDFLDFITDQIMVHPITGII